MNCKEVKENLVAYLDGELAPEKVEEFDKHLEECGECSREVSDLQHEETIAFKTLDSDAGASGDKDDTTPPRTDEDSADRQAQSPETPTDADTTHDEDTHFAEGEAPMGRPVKWEKHTPVERRPIVWIAAAAIIIGVVVFMNLPPDYFSGYDRQEPPTDQPDGPAVESQTPEGLGALLEASNAVLTRVLNTEPTELAGLKELVLHDDLLGRLDYKQSRIDKDNITYQHIERLKLVMLHIVNAAPDAAELELAALRNIIYKTDLQAENDAIKRRLSATRAEARRQK